MEIIVTCGGANIQVLGFWEMNSFDLATRLNEMMDGMADVNFGNWSEMSVER